MIEKIKLNGHVFYCLDGSIRSEGSFGGKGTLKRQNLLCMMELLPASVHGTMSCVDRQWFLEVLLNPCIDFHDRIISVFNAVSPKGPHIFSLFSCTQRFLHLHLSQTKTDFRLTTDETEPHNSVFCVIKWWWLLQTELGCFRMKAASGD